jgi:hypothetical protein
MLSLSLADGAYAISLAGGLGSGDALVGDGAAQPQLGLALVAAGVDHYEVKPLKLFCLYGGDDGVAKRYDLA